MSRRQPPLNWTASRDGIRHAFHGRRGVTLCEIRVNEQFTRPDMPKCPACLAVEAAEAPCRR